MERAQGLAPRPEANLSPGQLGGVVQPLTSPGLSFPTGCTGNPDFPGPGQAQVT